LKNRRSENDKVPRGVWKAVEAKAEKFRMIKAKRRGEEKGRRKETRGEGAEEEERKEEEEKAKKGKDNGIKKSS